MGRRLRDTITKADAYLVSSILHAFITKERTGTRETSGCDFEKQACTDGAMRQTDAIGSFVDCLTIMVT